MIGEIVMDFREFTAKNVASTSNTLGYGVKLPTDIAVHPGVQR